MKTQQLVALTRTIGFLFSCSSRGGFYVIKPSNIFFVLIFSSDSTTVNFRLNYAGTQLLYDLDDSTIVDKLVQVM